MSDLRTAAQQALEALQALRLWMPDSVLARSLDTRIDNLKAALAEPQEPVPSGWKLVPVEPTDAMIRAVCNCNDADHKEQIGEDYRAMIAAAPAALAEPQEPVASSCLDGVA